ncbi:50S ribosomal protein L18 [Methylohalobius crimeensis]|uniref:50S ribosomal protein L18 n=1 Tax=Methylohalobius crimeensis TaxID=244365 RepID=UPI0003B5BF33|nr:50S ribosomal protein L18 [Methylohalobius crimeensis]
MDKKASRMRRAAKSRGRIHRLGVHRLTVHRTPKHIYAQITTADGAKVLASAATVQAEIRGKVKNTGNVEAAQAVGAAIAEQAVSAGIEKVAFDRSGFLFHGRVKALAEAAREGGLRF